MSDKFIHPFAIVDEGANLGCNTKVWAWTHIMNGAIVGDNCNIGEHSFIENGVIIGNNVKIKNNVALYSGLECEDDVFFGPNCVFTNVINPRSFVERKHEFKKTIIKRGASIGANATIVCGNTIGEYAFIGAGAVVTKDVNPFTIVVGNPAKFYSYICVCGNKIGNDLKCKYCGKKYLYIDKTKKLISIDNSK